MAEMMKLKPCPFCGSKARIINDAGEIIIECSNVDCKTICETRNAETECDAIKAWNTRAEEPTERTAHWDINCDGYYPYCSNCLYTPKAHEMTPYCPRCGTKMVTRELMPQIQAETKKG